MAESTSGAPVDGVRKLNVTLGFLVDVDVEGEVDARQVGQEMCRLFPPMPQIGCVDWIATPTGVVFLQSTETPA